MTIILRQDQLQLKNDVYAGWNAGHRNMLATLPTGGGKSILVSDIVLDADRQNLKQVIIAHRNELVSQMSHHVARRGIAHRVIGSNETVRQIMASHREEFGRSFVNPTANATVAGIDTLIARADTLKEWAIQQSRWTIDEAHHVLRLNKWGRGVEMFPNALGLGVTATAGRPDGQGLGRGEFINGVWTNDGVFDNIVVGPNMRWLIDNGFLSDYEIVCPASDLQIDDSAITDGGDYSPKKLKAAAEKSKIVGDVVREYCRYAIGKRAICFATDVETSNKIAQQFNDAGIRAASVSAKTPSNVREEYIRRFKRGDIKVLVNVDLFDEGFDCLDMRTEILTPNGWKNAIDAMFEKECYAWNSETGEAEMVPIMKHAFRPLRDGEKMLSIESQHTDVRVTENHRIFMKEVNYYKYGGTSDKIEVKTAREIHENPEQKFALPICAHRKFEGVKLSDDEIRVLGWYMTDGYLNRNNILEISQVKKHQIENIRNLLDRLDWSYKERSRVIKNGYKPGIVCVEFQIARRQISHLLPFMNKYNPPALFDNMTKEQFAILWQTMMDGNGSKQDGKSGYVVTVHKLQADKLMAMAVVRGFAAMYGTYETKNNVTMYNMRIRDEKWMQFYQKDKRGARFTFEEPKRKEIVWCVTNRLGTLITRRNGKIVVLGNCPGTDVVIMARPTASIVKYLQQFGRALRTDPFNPSKVALIIDHVSNVIRHGLPDKPRDWGLDRRDKRGKQEKDPEDIPLTRCGNFEPPACGKQYERFRSCCPHCGWVPPLPEPGARTVQMVDGDLVLLDRAALEEKRRAMFLEDPASMAQRISNAAGGAAAQFHMNKQIAKIQAQTALRAAIEQWAGVQRWLGRNDSESFRRFYLTTGIDVLDALAADRTRDQYEEMTNKIKSWTDEAVQKMR